METPPTAWKNAVAASKACAARAVAKVRRQGFSLAREVF